MPPSDQPATVSVGVERARARLIARRQWLFALGWLSTSVAWLGVFVAAKRVAPIAAVLHLTSQAAILGALIALSRARVSAPVLRALTCAACILLGVSSIMFCARVGPPGDVIAFMLLTLYLMAAVAFAWGWRHELALLVGTMVPMTLVFARLDFLVAPLELLTAIGVGAMLSLAVAEAAARSFGFAVRRRESAEAAARELALSRNAYRDLAENARDFIWSGDLEGRVTYLNEAGARGFGGLPSDFIGLPVDDFTTDHPANPLYADLVARLVGGETMPPTRVQMPTVLGPRWLEIVVTLMHGPGGEPVGVRGISRDVHERVLAEERLRASETRYRGLVETQHEAVVRFDLEGRLTFVNDYACRAVGRNREELLGQSFLPYVAEEDRPATLDAIHAILQPPFRVVTEGRLHTPAGRRWFEWESVAILDDDGRAIECQSVGRDATGRIRARNALEESEARFRAVVESELAAFVRADIEGRITYVNDYLCRLVGRSRESLIGTPALELVHPDDHAVAGEALAATLRPPYRAQVQDRILTTAGWRWFEWAGGTLLDEHGHMVELQGLGHDIHERREAEQALRESEARYRVLVESQQAFLCRCDGDGTLTFVNDMLCQTTGHARADLLGHSFFDFVHPEDASLAREKMGELGRPPYRVAPNEVRCRTTRGWRWFEWEASGRVDEAGRLAEVQAMGRDVSERREAVEALRASEARYRGLVQSQVDLIMRCDLELRLTFVNDAYCHAVRIPREQLVGASLLPLIHEDDRPRALEALAEVRQPPYRVMLQTRGRATGRWFEWESCGVLDADGTLVELQSVGRDVTERRAAEEAVRRSLAELMRSQEQLRLLAQRQVLIREHERKRLGLDLHDDVCQELVGIGIMLESIRRRVGPTSAENATEFDRVARYLNQLVDHLRLLARELQPLQLRDLGLEGSLRSLAKGLTSETCYVDALFPTSIPRLGEETEVAVYRIAQEALTNAIRHSDAGMIKLMLATISENLCLEVSDDGRGFDPEDRSNALGLVSMEERALSLGGRLQIWSTIGCGTTVRLECPLGGRRETRSAA